MIIQVHLAEILQENFYSSAQGLESKTFQLASSGLGITVLTWIYISLIFHFALLLLVLWCLQGCHESNSHGHQATSPSLLSRYATASLTTLHYQVHLTAQIFMASLQWWSSFVYFCICLGKKNLRWTKLLRHCEMRNGQCSTKARCLEVRQLREVDKTVIFEVKFTSCFVPQKQQRNRRINLNWYNLGLRINHHFNLV